MDQLKGKVAVVIGASNGIGAATAKSLAAAGASVVVCYNKGAERARQVMEGLPGSTHQVQQIVLEDSATLEKAAGDVRAAYGRCDILINSAGFTKPVPHANLDGMTDDLMDSVLIANVRGPFATIRAFAPLMRETGDSVIINVSSIAGFTGSGSSIAYAAAKAALVSLGQARGQATSSTYRSPGAVNTEFLSGCVARSRPHDPRR
jgi:3-oxoacyl-[acyl-carrier protein] reductase